MRSSLFQEIKRVLSELLFPEPLIFSLSSRCVTRLSFTFLLEFLLAVLSHSALPAFTAPEG